MVGLLAWKDAQVLDDINKIYTAKYNTELEDDLLGNSDPKHHPVIQVIMSENRDDQQDWSQVNKKIMKIQHIVSSKSQTL